MARITKDPIHPGGPRLSRLIYGTWRILDGQDKTLSSPANVLARIKHCLALGVSTFDLADIYGGGNHQAEACFGEALRLEPELRTQMQLVTKCGIVLPEGNAPKHYDTSPEYIRRRVEESLRAVGTTYFDVLLIHRPDPFMDAQQVAQAMIDLRHEGKVLHFGVSNFLPHQVDLLQSRLPFPLVTNQIEMSVACLSALYDGTLDQCQKLNMAPMIWSPLAGGSLFKPAGGIEKIERLQRMLLELGKRHGGATVDQIAYAWLLAHPAKVHPILGTNDIDRISSAVKAMDIKLTRQEWFAILEASNGKRVP